jgi:hypothetical protein
MNLKEKLDLTSALNYVGNSIDDVRVTRMNDDSRHPLRPGQAPGPKEAAAWNQFALGRGHGSIA